MAKIFKLLTLLLLCCCCKSTIKESSQYVSKREVKAVGKTTRKKVTKKVLKVGVKTFDDLVASGKYVIKGGTKRFKILTPDGKELARVVRTRKQTVVKALWVSKGANKSSLNSLLNLENLLPNTTYMANGGKYVTDAMARPIESSLPAFAKADIVPRSAKMQREAVVKAVGKSRAKRYQGGHMIANSLGGISEGINIVPQFERVNKGTFAEIEGLVRKNRKYIKNYKVRNIYQGKSRIPKTQRITFELKGKKHSYFIANKSR
ncbi:DNA/RNA non-specific endonuclease [Halosquirtibacter xylanolyticus]|uniref:DNA/RNA non-specific endonuclease n=1 Tax=Halosquirtibacter xylanolyticus TaxID=3374599 RepID=UPI003749C5B2|nr:DNA/RNA non-specific endonuclease [Prolixibacteraceae bacterium]